MKVKAIKRGFDGKQIRNEGEEFEFAGKLGKWMVPVEAPKPAEVKKEEPKAKGKSES